MNSPINASAKIDARSKMLAEIRAQWSALGVDCSSLTDDQLEAEIVALDNRIAAEGLTIAEVVERMRTVMVTASRKG
jgi:hypothetical protein